MSPAEGVTAIAAALKVAVGSNAPGHYVHKIITKLFDRLHASKDWLVRQPSAFMISVVYLIRDSSTS